MHPVNLLVVLDGFGHRQASEHNAIALADTPEWDRLWSGRPHTLLSGSGEDVGLPAGQMGNSEVGHMNLGAGRVIYQDYTRINRAIDQGEFANNRAIKGALRKLDHTQGALHILGLLSPGGVHSHESQIFELIRLAAARGIQQVYLHAFLDGRDTPPRSASESLQSAAAIFSELGHGRVASIIGRYYAMDRDNNWERIEQAYNLIVRGEAPYHAEDPKKALADAYARDENDEFVQPTAIHSLDSPPITMADGDALIFMNFRADRARQITRAISQDAFDNFQRRSRVNLADFVMLTRYAENIDLPCAFDRQHFTNTLGEYLSKLGKTQLRIAETEKYAHVTFFFSGGVEACYPGEERALIPSPKVATYDLQPQMSAAEVTDQLVNAIEQGSHDVIICNYANGDMVGHTGKLEPAKQAVQTLDACLTRLRKAIETAGGQMLITADHGNCELMQDEENNQEHTAHTHNLVPLVYIGPQQITLAEDGTLSDVAPTLLDLMHLEIPTEMTGRSLATIQTRQTA